MVTKDNLTTASVIATVLLASTEAQMAKEGDLSGTHSMSGTFNGGSRHHDHKHGYR